MTKTVETRDSRCADVSFYGCVFLQPGSYTLWTVLFDRTGGKHNVKMNRVRIPEWRGDPLPELNVQSPRAEFPVITESSDGLKTAMPGHLHLPVSNQRPIQLDMLFVIRPSEQSAEDSNNGALAAIGTLSQMKLMGSSMSVVGFDLVKHEVMFTEDDAGKIDFPRLVDRISKSWSNRAVSIDALRPLKTEAEFFRQFLQQKLEDSSKLPRVVVVISESVQFDRGADLRPIKLNQDCRCRVFYVTIQRNKETFNDLGTLLKPVATRSFNVTSGQDMRKALAAIVHEIETF